MLGDMGLANALRAIVRQKAGEVMVTTDVTLSVAPAK